MMRALTHNIKGFQPDKKDCGNLIDIFYQSMYPVYYSHVPVIMGNLTVVFFVLDICYSNLLGAQKYTNEYLQT